MKHIYFILSDGGVISEDFLENVEDDYQVTDGDIEAVKRNYKDNFGRRPIVINYYSVDASQVPHHTYR